MKSFKYIFLLIIYVSEFFSSAAQTNNAFYVTRENGLSDSNVKTILIDHLGYVWFGTEQGLNRYDGFETVTYFHNNNDLSSLDNNNIRNLYEDFDGNIWVNTNSGLNFYNRKKNTFKRIILGEESTGLLISYEDETHVWLNGSGSFRLWLYNKNKQTFREENTQIHSDLKINKESRLYSACNFDPNNLLYLVSGVGLLMFDKTTKTFLPYLHLDNTNFAGLFIDEDYIWFSTRNNGIFKIHKNNKFAEHFNKDNSALSNKIILSFKRHPITKTLWIATDGDGILEFDKNMSLLNHFVSGSKVNQLLPANSVNTINFTKNGNIWAGTVRTGAVMLYSGNFEHFSYKDNQIAGPSSGIIVKIIEDSDANIWLATDDGGLNKFNPTSYSFQTFQKKGIEKITGVVNFSEDLLLVSVYLGDLYLFNKKTKTFSDAHLHPLFKNVPHNVHYRLFQDSKNNIWICANQLIKINTKENSIKLFTEGNYTELFNQISPSFYSASEDTVNQRIWFGSINGIFAYNYKTNRIEHPVNLNNYRNSFGSSVFSVFSSQNSKVLFGTAKGLFIYNPKTQLTSNYWEEENFKNTVFQTLFEINNVLWAATSDGLLKIVPNATSNNVIKYKVGNHDFRSSSFLYSTDHKVYLGTNNGFIRFSPDVIVTDTLASPVIITSFNQIGTKRNQEYVNNILPQIQDETKPAIPFANSVYQIQFNSFDIPFQEEIEYSYVLEGFEELWHTGKSRIATYTNLNPGNYTFKVKASTSNRLWNEEFTAIQFEILPPWWLTLWFKIVFIAFIFGLAGFVWNELLKRAKLKHLVEVEKNEQKRLREVNEMKLRFFTNISHELRTPLTLIYSPLKKLIKRGTSSEDIKNEIPVLFRNAERMKILVDQILEFRKAEIDELSLNLTHSDFIDFCREVIDAFHFMAHNEKIKIKFLHDVDLLNFNFDRDKLNKILYNLISNAIKHTPKNGLIELRVSHDNQWVYISVSDTGDGIPEIELDSIFERYYQLANKIQGTGIGLALTKKLVTLHEGEIRAENNPDKGAVFKIKIPYNKTETNKKQTKIPEKKALPEELQNQYQNASPTPVHNISLLIIEDDWELRKYLEKDFSPFYKIITANNGKNGLLVAVESLPDLIITDVMMPELDGYEFCKALRNDLRISHIPVVMLTAKTMSENKIEGYKSGADLYVAKPFDKDVLHSQLEGLLQNRALLKERFNKGYSIKTEEVTHSETDEKFLQKAISIVELNLQNTQFDVSCFVAETGISRTLAYKKIKAITGMSINDFILSIRLQKAGILLKQTQKSVSEIAIETGFSDHSYFSAVFKKNIKVSPSEFRQLE